MSWQGQQPPAYNPAYNPTYNQPHGSNPSAPPPQQGQSYNPYQQTPPPTHGGAPPTYGGAPPTHGGAPPTHGGAPPTHGGAPPTHGGAPPTHGGAPPTYGGAPPTHGGAQAGGYRPPPPAGYGAPGYGASGYGAGAPNPPPGADPTLWSWFQAVDANHSNSITSTELQQALVNGNWTTFNEETCRLMIGMFDTNRDGTINFQEFAALWKYIQDWNRCFQQFDADRSGNIDAGELSTAFRTFGYNLSPQFTNMIVRKFDRANRNTINFDDFIQCCVMLKALSEAFKKKDKNMTGTINIHYEEFLEMVLENAM